jgi:hypothetical protein
LRKDIKSWGLLLGALLIVGSCAAAYFLTIPAEADVSILKEVNGAYVISNV